MRVRGERHDIGERQGKKKCIASEGMRDERGGSSKGKMRGRERKKYRE